MARANPQQKVALEQLREDVLGTMQYLPSVQDQALAVLDNLPLGVLRRSATQRHGVTRWRRGADGTLVVETVDLHPNLLCEAWNSYAKFVLYHEFLHALGWRAHDMHFRGLEALWPDAAARRLGPSFTQAMRTNRATWMWSCSTCDQRFPRQKRGNGRYICRTCRTPLLDVPVHDAQ